MSKQSAEKIEAYKERKAALRKIRYNCFKSEGVDESIPRRVKSESELKEFLAEKRRKRGIARLSNIERERSLAKERAKRFRDKKRVGDPKSRELTDCNPHPWDDEITVRRKKARLSSREYYRRPLGRLAQVCRRRLSNAFSERGLKKNTKTSKMVGCSWSFLERHITRQFKKGMNWDNYGKWHIDHIVPLALAGTEEDLMKLSHFSNLQPMWAAENLAKGSKVITCQPELILHYV